MRDIFILPCMANKYKWNDWEKFLDEFAPICPKTLIKFYSQVKNEELSICLTP